MPFLHWKLSELRVAAGMTQAEAAEKAGLKKGTYVDLEQGRNGNPGLETVEKAAALFGVDACELIGSGQSKKVVSRGRPKKA